MRLLLAAIFVLFGPISAWAEEQPSESVSFAGAMLQMLAALAIVLGLMLVLYWVMRKLNPRQMLSMSAGGLKVWGRIGLGSRKSVALLEVGRKMLLVGLGDKEVVLLREIDDPEEIAELKSNSGVGFARRKGKGKSTGFTNVLKRKQADEDD